MLRKVLGRSLTLNGTNHPSVPLVSLLPSVQNLFACFCEPFPSTQALINLLYVDKERVIDQDFRIYPQIIGDDFPNPREMQVPSIQLILTRPLSSGNDQAGNLFGGQFFRVNDDIEIAAVIDVNPVDFQVPFPVLLVALQRSIE